MKKLNYIFLPVFLAGIFLTQVEANAQETTEKKWKTLAELYLMFPNMKGDVGIRSLPSVSVDADESDILGNLKFGAMLYVEANNGDWAIGNDIIYMKLEQGLEASQVINGGKATMEEFAWELSGLKRVSPVFELGFGTRLMSVGAELEVQGSEEFRTASISKTWVDPILIARTQGKFHEKWLWQVRGDIGGAGIGSQITWQAQAYAGYQFSKTFQTTIGYRYIGVNYDKGEGDDRFRYDIDTYGWVMRLGFNF
jgi:hypothetical protein